MKKFYLIFISALISISTVFAERTLLEGFSQNVNIDIPSGFKLVANNGTTSYQLESDCVPVTAIIKIHEAKAFKSTKDALSDTLKKLGVKSDIDTISWRGGIQSLGMFSGNLMGKNVSGFAVTVIIPENKKMITVASWCPEEQKDLSSLTITSLLDSINIDVESHFTSGLFTSYAFPASKKTVEVMTEIDGKEIKSKLFSNDMEAAEYVIEREYSILKLYQQRNDWKEAWTRYYRMIFRDSCSRLRQFAFDAESALASDCSDYTDYAQKLLEWTQTFKYEREKSSSDFASLPSILLGGGSDCDSRSMLLAVMLQCANQDAIMFVSAVHSHAVAGLVSDHPGFCFKANGKDYLIGETTAKDISWGKINQSQKDQKDWITVMLP
ncbi:MAG: hypothetical protein K6B17_06695 [Treponema sp.]|nr:hypothetical protein [Treponema sp.]